MRQVSPFERTEGRSGTYAYNLVKKVACGFVSALRTGDEGSRGLTGDGSGRSSDWGWVVGEFMSWEG
jgi:hypothetical protein